MTAIYIAIAVAFILNLIIIFALRLYDKKDKSLKMINSRITAFRNEVNTTTARINTGTQDSEQRINLKLDEANSVINSVAETLDILQVHQKELSDLSDVCRNYENALNSLKQQTEQAESRIIAVQAQIREAKEFSSYIDQFSSDSERIKNQLTETRQNYILLVTDTQSKLQAQASLQEEANSKMLTSFSVAMERFKIAFSDFVNKERDSFSELCVLERETATKNINMLSDRANEINIDLESSKTELGEFKTKLEESLSRMGEDKESLLLSIEKIKADTLEEMKLLSESAIAKLEEEINKKQEDVFSSIALYDEKLSDKEKKVEDVIKTLEAKKELAKDSFESSIDNSKKQVDLLIENLNKEKDLFVSRCREVLNQEFDAVLKHSDDEIGKLKAVGEDLVNLIMGDIASAQETATILSDATEEKVEEAIDKLNQLKVKLDASHQEIFKLGETITNRKEEIWELEKESKRLNDENQELVDEIKGLSEDISQLKEKRIEEEGNLVRIKAQRSQIDKEDDEKEALEAIAKGRRVEDMVEVFPDELVDDISSNDDF